MLSACPSTMNTPRTQEQFCRHGQRGRAGRFHHRSQVPAKFVGRLAMGALGYRRHGLEGWRSQGLHGSPCGLLLQYLLAHASNAAASAKSKPAATARAKAVKTVRRAPSASARRDDRDCLPLQRPGQARLRVPLCTQGPARRRPVGDPRPRPVLTELDRMLWSFHRRTLLPIALPMLDEDQIAATPVSRPVSCARFRTMKCF